MPAYFLDSSALVKRFISEAGTSWVLRLFKKSNSNSIFIARVTPVETVAGLAKQNRIGNLLSHRLEKAVNRLMRGIESRYAFVGINQTLVLSAIALVQRFGLRGFDAIQLAAAIVVAERRRATGLSDLVLSRPTMS